MPKAILMEQSVGESILLATVQISKQLKPSEQTAEGTAETRQNPSIQDYFEFTWLNAGSKK